MKRRTLGVIAALVLGAVGTFVLVAYVRDAEDRAVAGEKMAVGDMGFAAYFKDSEGNVMGLWQNAH